MAFELIPMNLTALQDITPPNISLSDTSLSSIVSNANFYAQDYLILGSMLIVLIVMYLTLSDRTPFQDFGYDDMRALNLASSTSTLLGLTMFSVGWSENFVSVGMFGTVWLLSSFYILIYENKE